jgi:hypothetical protein
MIFFFNIVRDIYIYSRGSPPPQDLFLRLKHGTTKFSREGWGQKRPNLAQQKVAEWGRKKAERGCDTVMEKYCPLARLRLEIVATFCRQVEQTHSKLLLLDGYKNMQNMM